MTRTARPLAGLLLLLALALAPGAPGAQPAAGTIPIDRDTPVVFTADEVEYDDSRGLVTARGRVEAWQGERFVRAERFTYDRNTGVAMLSGNVQLIEADGQAFFAEEAELTEGFRDGVLSEIRARLLQNARIAAAGARRTGGEVTELARVVYSSCDLCPADPTRPPLWQLRARLATQDRLSERVSYRDAVVQVAGVPVFYAPFFSHPDPQTPRSSGFLAPEVGYTEYLGTFARVPYYWAIDAQQDLTVSVAQGSRDAPQLQLGYRRAFNNGLIEATGSVGPLDQARLARLNLQSLSRNEEIGGHLAARVQFHLNETWRVGLDANRASSEAYLRVYGLPVARVLPSVAFLEGFWTTERYVRLDARAYQGLRRIDDTDQIPLVAPNFLYEEAPRSRVLGGFLTFDAGALGLTRDSGTRSQRLASRLAWERPIPGALGEQWTVRVQTDLRAYAASGQQNPPANLPDANGESADANLRLALDWRWPLVRPAGEWGQQLIEPRLQVVTGPRMTRQTDRPNEDSIDFDLTEANLFQLNRFTGRDRLEGGTRLDAALRASWYFPNGGRIEGIAGRSFRAEEASIFPVNTGLDRRESDWVGRASLAPVPWLEFMGRTRLDSRTGEARAQDATAFVSLGQVGPLGNVFLSATYFESPQLPFLVNDIGRREAGVGGGAQWRTPGGGVWRANGSFRYDLRGERPVLLFGSAGYEDECLVLEAFLQRSYGIDPTTNREFRGNTTVLFRVALKTVGDLFLRAI